MLPQKIGNNTRKLCFHGLSARIREYSQCKETPFRGEEILPDIDNKVSSFVKDTNASARNASLDLALQYSEFCMGASDFEIAKKISQSKSVPFFVNSQKNYLFLIFELDIIN